MVSVLVPVRSLIACTCGFIPEKPVFASKKWRNGLDFPKNGKVRISGYKIFLNRGVSRKGAKALRGGGEKSKVKSEWGTRRPNQGKQKVQSTFLRFSIPQNPGSYRG